MTTHNIKILHCNNIDQADIAVEQGRLNIKYGPNGIGKSTISKAIVGQIRDDGSLSDLLPFKYRALKEKTPKVEGVEEFGSALVFDESFVGQFVFQQDEVVQNSFEIFIKTPEYDNAMKEITQSFEGIQRAFQENRKIEQTIKGLKDLRDAFGKANKNGTISKTSKVMKAFGAGNKIDNIPDQLMPFEIFIRSEKPSEWIGWQIKGGRFLELGDKCPYCAGDLSREDQKNTVLAVSKEYNATAVDHLNNLKEVIHRLRQYFSEQAQENLEKIIKAKLDLDIAQTTFLGHLKTSINALIEHLETLQSISFFSLRDVDVNEIEGKLRGLKIDLKMIGHMDSKATQSVIDPINDQLDKLLTDVSNLKGKVNRHKAKIKKTIEDNEQSINGFLRSAGYRYKVSIVAEAETYKMRLAHDDLIEPLEMAFNHLSYGERNAFALVLFMHQVNSEKPSLIVLDDPISSFDKNKKFAILHELFTGKGSLKDFTTLMLTHDIESAIDVVKINPAQMFQNAKPTASFLTVRDGVVSEKEIQKNDIQPFTKIYKDIVESDRETLVKAIY